ncbi:hypothetical protein [Enterococcus sp. LJL90]
MTNLALVNLDDLKILVAENDVPNEERTMVKKQTTLRLPVDLYGRIQQEAERKGHDIKSLIVFALWEYFDNAVS